ncbi:very-long-chain (3R)-3-hydroxyacyl-CoA dehydratase [Malassezia psittaci]|uniref:Very-long-chain (3R)-3-hydroxyacyl-CoA dehydratase n=1 Tax=Malassezia psittaci TaxID=1821823 RepID=A0AAF0FA74_9BASI|nr:very-long-chain (3R)-3-hydroxyacyl-CoA dehydratase [Malassezia psittaci]
MGSKTAPPAPKTTLTFYLVVYNLLQFVGWLRIFIGLNLYLLHGSSARKMVLDSVKDFVTKYTPEVIASSSVSFAQHHPYIQVVLDRMSSVHEYIGPLVVIFQSLAVLEVVHAAFGWVKASPVVVAIQVASRLIVLWLVTEKYHSAATSPYYAVMVFAWSLSEVARYPFYVTQVLNTYSYMSMWMRYSFFIVLYPMGVLGEMQSIWATLPHDLPWPWVDASGWSMRDLAFLFLLPVYVPGLFYLYTRLLASRRKVLGNDFVGSKGKAFVKKHRDEYLARFNKLNDKSHAALEEKEINASM